jgi:mannosyl-oligosaccharide alpha-1,2-mannosidase
LVNHDDDGSGVADGERAGIGGGRGRGLRVGGVTGGLVGPSGDAVRERVVVDDHDDDDIDTVGKALGRRGGRASTATPSTSTRTTSYWARVAADPKRRDAVRAAAKEAFGAFWKSALGHDELAPASGTGRDDFGGIDATLIDSLDTLHLMGLTKEFENALLYLKKPDSNFRRLIRGERDKDVSVFETNIRVLGGLLSTYDLTGDPDVLDLAESMASRLSAAFDTKSGVPTSFVNVKSRQGVWIIVDERAVHTG